MALTLSMTALSVETLPEPDLIDAARDGDDRAFEELYARYRERIAAFIHARVRDHGRAEDVIQEVFISALRRLRASDREIQFKPWIYEIAKNACIDEYRRTRRAREVSLDAGEDDARPTVLLSLAPTPVAAMETKERLSDLRGAFGGLSESHHQLLVLREFEGLSYDEIGERTGMSRQMVESALFRARRKLTEEYEELASGRRCEQIQAAIADGRASSARELGIRERRRFARHLSHCQACRTHAHLAGVDEALVERKSLSTKIAALLPFGIWRWPWGSGRARHAAAQVAAHPTAQALQKASEPAAATSLSGAAVAVAVLALGGVGAVNAPAAPGHHLVLRPAAQHGVSVPAAQAAPAMPGIADAPHASGIAAAAHARLQPGHIRRTAAGSAARGRRAGHGSGGAPGSGGSTAATGADRSHAGLTTRLANGAGSATTTRPGDTIRAAGGGLGDATTGVANQVSHLAGHRTASHPLSAVGKVVSSTTQAAANGLGGAADVATGAGDQATATLTGATQTAVSGATVSTGQSAAAAG